MNSWMRLLMTSLNKEVSKQNTSPSKSMSRRRFLEQTSKAGIGLGLSLTLPPLLFSCKKNSNSIDEHLLDVAILGAGIAGLNCGKQLLNTNLNFKIFEGSNRLGGRILTHYNDALQLGIFPEFGGDFIDSNHEDMLALTQEFKLELVDLIAEQEAHNWSKDVYYFDNRKIDEKEIIKEFGKITPKILEDKMSLGENYNTSKAKELDHLPLSDYIASLPCATWMKDLLDAAFVAEYGLDCKQQSTLNMLDLIETNTDEGFNVFGESDERFRIKGGNSQLIQKISEKIGEDKILRNYEVTGVQENTDGNFVITFKNGQVVKAKTVVCTLPFTILRNLTLDLKNMSSEKRKCIDELGYGNNTKLILGYDGQPWRSAENHAMGYLFTKDMTNGWDGSLNRTKNNPHGAYVAYFGGQFSQDLCDESFKNPMAPPAHVWRTALPEDRVLGFVTELEKIFPGSKAKFKNRHVFVNWIEYPFVKASYSCYKTGQWTSISGLEMQPVGNFFFAGEHCSQAFQGFMNGAAETGRRVGERLAKAYKTTESAAKN